MSGRDGAVYSISYITDADWATNPENRRSVDSVHVYQGTPLIETSSCTQQVTALSSAESEFYGLLRGAAVGLQIRELLREINIEMVTHQMVTKVLTDSAAARGIVRRSGSGRVKHLEARWLWIQERVRVGDVIVGCVDTQLNTASGQRCWRGSASRS